MVILSLHSSVQTGIPVLYATVLILTDGLRIYCGNTSESKRKASSAPALFILVRISSGLPAREGYLDYSTVRVPVLVDRSGLEVIAYYALWSVGRATPRSRDFIVAYPVSYSLRYLYIRPILRISVVCSSVRAAVTGEGVVLVARRHESSRVLFVTLNKSETYKETIVRVRTRTAIAYGVQYEYSTDLETYKNE